MSVGIIANPAAGRDIRRLVARASVFPIAEKCNMIMRILSGLGALGITKVFLMQDASGIAGRVRRGLQIRSHDRVQHPRLIFLETSVADGPAATLAATRKMVAAGVRVIIVLGGDGTHRLVAQFSEQVPITALSTGTNNVFPTVCEATTAGLATALVAKGQILTPAAIVQNKVLHVSVGDQEEIALVDVCVSTDLWTGSKAVWQTHELDQLFVTFAEPDATGLSTIAGLIHPLSRRAPHGLSLNLVSPTNAPLTVNAPIAPGLVLPIGVSEVRCILPGDPQPVRANRGVIALDGERMIEFDGTQQVRIWLDKNGPRTVQVKRVMEVAAQQGLLTNR